MIYLEKDPTLKTLLLQEALKARGFYHSDLDNWEGPATEDALAAAQKAIRAELKPEPDDDLPNLHRDINANGRKLIKEFEGLQLTAYQDEVKVWTIGWGHTGLVHNDGTVRKGRTITLQQAEDLFSYDMDYFEGQIEKLVKVPLNDNQFAAMVAFTFNVGEGNLKSSTLLRLLNAKDYSGAADQFGRWNRAGGEVYAGLTRRRASERNLFLGKENFIVPG